MSIFDIFKRKEKEETEEIIEEAEPEPKPELPQPKYTEEEMIVVKQELSKVKGERNELVEEKRENESIEVLKKRTYPDKETLELFKSWGIDLNSLKWDDNGERWVIDPKSYTIEGHNKRAQDVFFRKHGRKPVFQQGEVPKKMSAT